MTSSHLGNRDPGPVRLWTVMVLLLAMFGLLSSVPATVVHAVEPARAAVAAGGSLTVARLATERRRNPLGIDSAHPRLAWAAASERRGARQTAFQVNVSVSRGALVRGSGLVWDSGKVASAQQSDVRYDGRDLDSRTRYFWRVRVWDEQGHVSPWSSVAWFETAFMDAADEFGGMWIGRALVDPREAPEPLLRKEFDIAGSIESARLYIAGLGYHIAEINGRRVGDHELDPGFTAYSNRVFYVTHDVTDLLREGTNAIGVRLGRGYYASKGTVIVDDNHNWATAPWHSEPKLKAVLAVTYRDGTVEEVVTDSSWTTSDGPTTVERPGFERYDARLEQRGWTRPGFDDADWSAALPVLAPGGRCDEVIALPNLPVVGCPGTRATLVAQPIEPQRVTRRDAPVRVSTPVQGTRLYEFPTVTAGWSRIVMRGAAGTEVKIRYSEKLAEDGQAALQGLSKQEDTYILRGGGWEVYRPSYSYKGFQYVQLTATEMPDIKSVRAEQVTDDLRSTARFASSNAQLNAYHAAMRQTSLINLHSIPTDTPTYEKAGWTADAHLFGTSVMRNFDAAALYEKFVQDMVDSQLPTGDVPSIVPSPADLNLLLDPAWGGAIVLVPYDLYQTYGDVDVLRRAYPAMRGWMSAMEAQIGSTGYIYNGPVAYGDWVTPVNGKVQSAQIHGTAYVFRAASLMAEMAAVLGVDADVDRWSRLADSIRDAYDARFFDPAAGGYLNAQSDSSPLFPEHGTAEPGAYAQTSQVEALAWGLVDGMGGSSQRRRATVLRSLVDDVVAKGNHLATGASGTKWLLPVLTDGGHAELAYKVALNKTYPGWGFWYANGATTMWETWAENARSRGHAFLGTVDDWLFTHVAGLSPAAPGFRTIDYRPYPGGGLRWAAASQETAFGTAATCWTRGRGPRFGVDVTVPVGSNGRVWIPARSAAGIREVGTGRSFSLDAAPGVARVSRAAGRVVVRVESGQYRFEVGDAPTCPRKTR